MGEEPLLGQFRKRQGAVARLGMNLNNVRSPDLLTLTYGGFLGGKRGAHFKRNIMEYPKKPPIENKEYRDFTRNKGEVFHHEPSLPGAEKLMSGKCSDYYGVSLSKEDHERRHYLGYLTYWAGVFSLDVMAKEIRALVTVEVQRVVIQNLIDYIEENKAAAY